jgi:hypothetical protein
MFGQMSGVSSSHQGKEKSFYQHMAANINILRYNPPPPLSPILNHLDVYVGGHFIPLEYSAPI